VFTAAKAMQKMLAELKAKHTTREYLDYMTTFDEYNNMVGMKELTVMESKYKVDEFKSASRK
jgi:2-methylisocitrate lyase-like PEP mutase family enzyme